MGRDVVRSQPAYTKDFMIDYQQDLGAFLGFVGDVATAIRMNSAYNSEAAHQPHTSHDVMWLADSLHGLHRLGDAISSADFGAIVSACDAQIAIYRGYQEVRTGRWQSPPHEAFERSEHLVSLDRGIAILRSIRDNALLEDPGSSAK
jgi:hypothetical protein